MMNPKKNRTPNQQAERSSSEDFNHLGFAILCCKNFPSITKIKILTRQSLRSLYVLCDSAVKENTLHCELRPTFPQT